ncbi:MAG TPA: hypothetical protein PKE45_08630 [Caldilineaceae bacterium]|nr:hypothetical protein [Caldilineaceae bacterium]
MGYTPEQHATVDAELEAMWERLIEIAVEIEKLAVPTNRHGTTYVNACQAADAVGRLRDSLAQERRHHAEWIVRGAGKV